MQWGPTYIAEILLSCALIAYNFSVLGNGLFTIEILNVLFYWSCSIFYFYYNYSAYNIPDLN